MWKTHFSGCKKPWKKAWKNGEKTVKKSVRKPWNSGNPARWGYFNKYIKRLKPGGRFLHTFIGVSCENRVYDYFSNTGFQKKQKKTGIFHPPGKSLFSSLEIGSEIWTFFYRFSALAKPQKEVSFYQNNANKPFCTLNTRRFRMFLNIHVFVYFLTPKEQGILPKMTFFPSFKKRQNPLFFYGHGQ